MLLYGRYVASVPVFKGLAPEIIAALSLKCNPTVVTKGQKIIQEGEPGREMYIIISVRATMLIPRQEWVARIFETKRLVYQGEVEVTETIGEERRQLGFLGDGAFFGESPVRTSRISLALRVCL